MHNSKAFVATIQPIYTKCYIGQGKVQFKERDENMHTQYLSPDKGLLLFSIHIYIYICTHINAIADVESLNYRRENFNFPTFILFISLPKSSIGKYHLIPFEIFHIRSNFIMNIQRHNQFSCLHLTQLKTMFSALKRHT